MPWVLIDRRTGQRVGNSIAGRTREQAEREIAALAEQDARGRRPDLHDLIPHLDVVQLTEQTWGSRPGDVITRGPSGLLEVSE